MKKIISLVLIIILALSVAVWAAEDTDPELNADSEIEEVEDEDEDEEVITEFTATEPEKNAILVENESKTYEDITVNKTGDGYESKGSEYYDWYGYNAAILASGDADIKITGTTTEISTEATYATAVFAYKGMIDISDATITTSRKNSGGIMVTGGGTIIASDLTVETTGDSSAAIRSDRGGGNITVTGGTYETYGKGSPAIYSTANIKVTDATLNSDVAQGVVIEGGNSVTLQSTDITAEHTEKNGQDSTYQAVLIYQSGSGDASEGKASFDMTGGSIANYEGDIFCVTNTACEIALNGVTITNYDEEGNFLRAEGQNWGKQGSNGGDVTLTASRQEIEGKIIISSDSSLNITLKDYSALEGAILASSSPSIDITLQTSSTLTGDVIASGNAYIDMTLNASSAMTGNVQVSNDSSLVMKLKGLSAFEGAFNPDDEDSTDEENEEETEEDSETEELEEDSSVSVTAAGVIINVEVESGSKITLTGNSYITSFSLVNTSDIDYGDYTLAVANDNKTYSKDEPRIGTADVSYGGNSGSGGSSNSSNSSNSGSSSSSGSSNSVDSNLAVSKDVSPDKILIGPSGAGCNVSYAGMPALLACATLIMKKK